MIRRERVRAVEESTDHRWETPDEWLWQAHAYAETVTATLGQDAHLSIIDIDAFWPLVCPLIGQLRRL
jgi:hypothetical protein